MGDKCACGCGKDIDTSVSDYFAAEQCQRRWNRRRAGLPTTDADPLDAVLDTIRAAATRRRQRDTPTVAGVWREIGYTTPPPAWEGVDIAGGGEVYYTPPHPARWWAYNRRTAIWSLRETDGVNTRDLYYVTDEMAIRLGTDAPALGAVLDSLRRRFGGHIPPLPTTYID